MQDYEWGEQVQSYDKDNPQEKKHDFKDGRPNIGWKLHLNVSPKNVIFVSEYLKNNGYVHKYLSGENAEKGKIFTIYIGSISLATKLAHKLENNLQKYLLMPNAREYIFSSAIVGRFVSDEPKYSHYGTTGYSWLSDDYRAYLLRSARHSFEGNDGSSVTFAPLQVNSNGNKEKFKSEAERDAFISLCSKYREYFYDPILIDSRLKRFDS